MLLPIMGKTGSDRGPEIQFAYFQPPLDPVGLLMSLSCFPLPLITCQPGNRQQFFR